MRKSNAGWILIESMGALSHSYVESTSVLPDKLVGLNIELKLLQQFSLLTRSGQSDSCFLGVRFSTFASWIAFVLASRFITSTQPFVAISSTYKA